MIPCQKNIEEALLILNEGGKANDVQELIQLSKNLKKCKTFNYARRILALASNKKADRDTNIQVLQQWALCTSKDVDLQANDRFEKAIKILEAPVLDLENTNLQETLGIAGGIYKRQWEATSTQKYLEISMSYYGRGYQQGIFNDNGYCAINAAFTYDLLAYIELKEKNITSEFQNDTIKEWKETASKIREAIITELEKKITDEPKTTDWWILATLAEAKFGLKKYDEAKKYLSKGMFEYRPDDWELETTTKQLARLATMQANADAPDMVNSDAWNVLKTLLNDPEKDISALYTAFEGKIGLALSGGGFRASLYHIGVLARLAELDVLHKIEVLSCVSGGSIIGGYYYLEVRKLLQNKTDNKINAQDYIEIVDRISTEFLTGVQRNIRTRVIADWWSNFKMMFFQNYSRTNKLGELYEKELFSRISDDNQRWLNKLFIFPQKENGELDESFKPKYDNRLRRAKVPVLILNATTLNTGHNWQFTASWMGESPAAIQEIDGNYRLRRMYYKDAGEEKYQRKIKLGAAVGASSSVPGMFEPLELSNLYEGKAVRLVDGGVHDNQGICGLLEQDCEVMLISDASGQMNSIDNPSRTLLGVPMRANDILMERVRNAQYQDMKKRLQAGLLKGLMFIHLKMDLNVEVVDWIHCEDPAEKDCNDEQNKITSYNIRKDLQTYLAAIRTDLDSFNDTEAYALMCSGYQMAKRYFPEYIKVSLKETKHSWSFLTSMEDNLKSFDLNEKSIKILEVAKSQTFKVWQLSIALKIISKILKVIGVIVLLGLLVGGIFYWGDQTILTVGKVCVIILFIIAGLFVSKWIINALRFKQTLMQFAIKLSLISVGSIIAFIHLKVFDKIYLKMGARK